MAYELLSHTNHNPYCDIITFPTPGLQGQAHLTYGIYVNGPDTGKEFCEYYSGPNYVVGASGRSYSRCYHKEEDVPKAYLGYWRAAREYYQDLMATREAELQS